MSQDRYFKTILVTGGYGFIGSNFIRYMTKKYPNVNILNLDKKTYAGNPKNLDDVKHSTIFGDICDVDIVDSLVRMSDVVVHFAAESHVDRSITGPSEFIKTNIVGTQVLLDACVKYNKHFHHISTDEVFGYLGFRDDKFNEFTPYNPSSPYSASKASADHLVRAYHKTYGLSVTITNCSNNYGPYQFPEKLIPLMIIKASKNEKLPIYGNGLNIRDWIHVEDHCHAIDLVLRQGWNGNTYLVGGDEERSNIDVVNTILNIMGKDSSLIEFVEDRPGHDLRYAIDSYKIKKELGWKPKHSFEEGLKQTVNWYLKNKKWWEPMI